MTENCKLRKAILSAFYILQRNFGILLILWCSFKLWWNFCLDLSRSKFWLIGEWSILSSKIAYANLNPNAGCVYTLNAVFYLLFVWIKYYSRKSVLGGNLKYLYSFQPAEFSWSSKLQGTLCYNTVNLKKFFPAFTLKSWETGFDFHIRVIIRTKCSS